MLVYQRVKGNDWVVGRKFPSLSELSFHRSMNCSWREDGRLWDLTFQHIFFGWWWHHAPVDHQIGWAWFFKFDPSNLTSEPKTNTWSKRWLEDAATYISYGGAVIWTSIGTVFQKLEHHTWKDALGVSRELCATSTMNLIRFTLMSVWEAVDQPTFGICWSYQLKYLEVKGCNSHVGIL